MIFRGCRADQHNWLVVKMTGIEHEEESLPATDEGL